MLRTYGRGRAEQFRRHPTLGSLLNFATKLAFWDWIFGTAHRPPEKPAGYGLVDADYPTGFFAQTLQAFRSTATPAERRS